MSTRALFHDEIEETTGAGVSDWVLSEQVLARWWCVAAFMKALDLLHQGMRVVMPHCNFHRNGHQSGYIIHCCFVCCCPGGRQGNTERVVARWRRPVASGVALDMLHRAMPHVLLQRLTMAIKMVCRGGAFVRCRRLFRLA